MDLWFKYKLVMEFNFVLSNRGILIDLWEIKGLGKLEILAETCCAIRRISKRSLVVLPEYIFFKKKKKKKNFPCSS